MRALGLSWRGYRDVRFRGKRGAVEGAAVVRPLHKREIELAHFERGEQIAGICAPKMHGLLGMALRMLGEQAGRDVVGDGAGAPQAKRNSCGAIEPTKLIDDTRLVVCHNGQSPVEKVSCGRGTNDAPARLEEAAANPGFQMLDVLRDRGLRDMELLRGAREAPQAVGNDEGMRAVIEHGRVLGIKNSYIRISITIEIIIDSSSTMVAERTCQIEGERMDLVKDARHIWKGLLFCLVIAAPAWLLGKQFEVIGGPVFAILIGMVLALVVPGSSAAPLEAGVKFTSKKILQYAVILLGFGLNLAQIAQVGATSLPIIMSTIATSLIISFVLCRALRIPSKISTLVGVGSSICGGSAIAATAPVIDADDEEIAQAISVIFLFNVIAALVFPTLGGMLGLSNEGFGLFAGTAVNDTSSVTAAAAAWDGMHPGANTLDSATIVKLTRTLAIIPITLALAFWQVRKAKRAAAEGRAEDAQAAGSFDLKKIFPFFILFFVLASIITTVFALPAAVTAPIKELSKFFIVMAMAAIGFNTNIVKLVRTGGKPILMGACCWVGIAAVSLGMQHLLGIW